MLLWTDESEVSCGERVGGRTLEAATAQRRRAGKRRDENGNRSRTDHEDDRVLARAGFTYDARQHGRGEEVAQMLFGADWRQKT